MNDMTHLWNIQPSRSQIGTYQHVHRAVSEFIQSPFPHLLLQPSMIDSMHYLLLRQILPYPLHTLSIIAEHNRLLSSEEAKESIEDG